MPLAHDVRAALRRVHRADAVPDPRVRSGLRGAEAEVQRARLAIEAERVGDRLLDVERAPIVSFHGEEDWDEHGKLRATAPVYDPFIRRMQNWG